MGQSELRNEPIRAEKWANQKGAGVRSTSVEPATHMKTTVFVKVPSTGMWSESGGGKFQIGGKFQLSFPPSQLMGSRRALVPQQRPSPPTPAGQSRLFAVID